MLTAMEQTSYFQRGTVLDIKPIEQIIVLKLELDYHYRAGMIYAHEEDPYVHNGIPRLHTSY